MIARKFPTYFVYFQVDYLNSYNFIQLYITLFKQNYVDFKENQKTTYSSYFNKTSEMLTTAKKENRQTFWKDCSVSVKLNVCLI